MISKRTLMQVGLAALVVAAVPVRPNQIPNQNLSDETVKQDLQLRAYQLYGADSPQITVQRPDAKAIQGDVVYGVVLKEADDKSEIFVDVNPCNGKIVAFHQPYTTQNAGTVHCHNVSLPKVAITQR